MREKGGVITEERFQKMTYAQWIFTYEECMRTKKKRDDKYIQTIEILETFATYSHEKINLEKLLSSIQQRRLKATAKETASEMSETYEQAMSVLPKTITVVEERPETQRFLPQTHVNRRKKRKKKKDL